MKTTKGGKVMNPTDAYRKELRKKELKWNKKERKKVREVGMTDSEDATLAVPPPPPPPPLPEGSGTADSSATIGSLPLPMPPTPGPPPKDQILNQIPLPPSAQPPPPGTIETTGEKSVTTLTDESSTKETVQVSSPFFTFLISSDSNQCERAIPVELQKMDAFTASFAKSLDSIKARAEETAWNQVKLGVMKSRLREAEDEFVKVLAVKTRNEAQQMAIKDSMSATRARIEELKRILQVQKARKDDYAAVMSQQTVGKRSQENEQKEGIEEAVFWYNRVLGFHIEGGHGVKFTFRNISMKNPCDEYSFTIRHENDTYTLLTCDPQINDTKDLIHELNRTNGFFKFVRTMREKFKEAASTGVLSECKVLHQESSTISLSAPALSVSTDRSESPLKNEHQREEIKKHSKMNNLGKGARQAVLSPVRKSPRFKAKK